MSGTKTDLVTLRTRRHRQRNQTATTSEICPRTDNCRSDGQHSVEFTIDKTQSCSKMRRMRLPMPTSCELSVGPDVCSNQSGSSVQNIRRQVLRVPWQVERRWSWSSVTCGQARSLTSGAHACEREELAQRESIVGQMKMPAERAMPPSSPHASPARCYQDQQAPMLEQTVATRSTRTYGENIRTVMSRLRDSERKNLTQGSLSMVRPHSGCPFPRAAYVAISATTTLQQEQFIPAFTTWRNYEKHTGGSRSHTAPGTDNVP
ncbi:unnamed protein product [Trichogramma brassicae]|uniref:Uncharacterized protein n=1 Tax=Trichogramma brassicae TaxID=86971 RepID=A0A6H5I390_9HYME|nr:unnamed protein product [Trichogramma brassicae]